MTLLLGFSFVELEIYCSVELLQTERTVLWEQVNTHHVAQAMRDSIEVV